MIRFEPGLQTHFPNDRLDLRFLEEVRPRVQWMRMDAQKADPDRTLAIRSDILSVGRRPLIICWEGAEARRYPPSHLEYQNERSIKLGNVPKLPGRVYRENWDRDFWPAVQAGGHVGYFGAAANFENRDLNWYRDTKAGTLPPEVRCTIHDYWTGSDAELSKRLLRWRQIIGMDRLYLISECGLQGGTDEQKAAYIARKWQFWSTQVNCLGMVFYQIFDSTTDDHDFGLYDEQQHLKQAVFQTFPLVQEDPVSAVSPQPLFKFDHAAVIHNPDGTKSLRWNIATQKTDATKDRVFSLQDTGEYQDRGLNEIGAWERGVVKGDRLVFSAGDARAVFAWEP